MSSKAFDLLATGYDQDFSDTDSGSRLRAKVHSICSPLLHRGAQVLELNCGTGEDALFLASNYCKVLATDFSEKMLEVARRRIQQHPAAKDVEFRSLDLRNLKIEEKYDIIFSNFGGLNCLSPDEMKIALQQMSAALRPDGKLILVLMPSFYWLESFYFLLKGSFRKIFRRMSNEPAKVILNGEPVNTWYYSVSKLQSLLPKDMKVLFRKPIGLFLPPPALSGFLIKRPALFRFLSKLEVSFPMSAACSSFADHYCVCIVRR
jgi:ubiquinone/menaquinone biosynthesis C-methylase UbiE